MNRQMFRTVFPGGHWHEEDSWPKGPGDRTLHAAWHPPGKFLSIPPSGNVISLSNATTTAFFCGYLKPSMDLPDCGCGEGTIIVDLASLVAPGQVVGVDNVQGSASFEVYGTPAPLLWCAAFYGQAALDSPFV